MDYIIGEDEKGKFVKFEKDGAQATIQDLKIAAEKKEFDILLVFMFDRLGRIPNEKRRIKKLLDSVKT